jgi:hypothetical protein
MSTVLESGGAQASSRSDDTWDKIQIRTLLKPSNIASITEFKV